MINKNISRLFIITTVIVTAIMLVSFAFAQSSISGTPKMRDDKHNNSKEKNKTSDLTDIEVKEETKSYLNGDGKGDGTTADLSDTEKDKGTANDSGDDSPTKDLETSSTLPQSTLDKLEAIKPNTRNSRSLRKSKPLYIGDFNKDRKVNIVDMIDLLLNWGSSHPLYDENADGVVNKKDLDLLQANWGRPTMLRGDIMHTEVSQHCRITDEEVDFVNSMVDTEMDNMYSRLADIDNDGKVTQEDINMITEQRDMSNRRKSNNSRADINCDRKVNAKDVELVQMYFGETARYEFLWTDVNYDGVINVMDLIEVLLAYN